MFGKGKKKGGKKIRGKKMRVKKLSEFFFPQVCLDETKMRGKEIEEELFSLVCLCGKVKGKKKIMVSNDNFTLMLFQL